MTFGFSYGFASSYTQLRDLIKTKIVAAGWLQVGVTEIYKSPAADANGCYAYVEVSDDAVSKVEIAASSNLNGASTALFKGVSSAINVLTWDKLWHFYIFDKWFYCFETNYTSNSTNAFAAAGIFRANPMSPFYHNPSFVYIGTGTEPGYWTPTAGSFADSGRIMYPDGVSRNVAPTVAMMSSVSSGAVRSVTKEQTVMGGGLFIEPVMLWSGDGDSHAIFGSLYNTIRVCGPSGAAAQGISPGCLITYGGKTYLTLSRPVIHAVNNTGTAIAMQIAGF